MLLRNPHRPLIRLTLIAAALVLFLFGYYWGNQYQRGTSTTLGGSDVQGILIRPPRSLPEFALQSADGHAFRLEDFTDHWTLLAFADPSRGPGRRMLLRMIEVRNRLAAVPGLQERLLLALVAHSQDPALAQDLARLSPALWLLAGDDWELRGLQASLGAPEDETGGIAIGPAQTELPMYLIRTQEVTAGGSSPEDRIESRLSALFPAAQTPKAIASDLALIAERTSTH